MHAQFKREQQEHIDQRLFFCSTDQKPLQVCRGRQTPHGAEGKETDAAFALWLKMVSVGNTPLSQISLDVLSI